MTFFKGPVDIGAGRGVPNMGSASYVTIEASGTSMFRNGGLFIGSETTANIDLNATGTAAFRFGLQVGPSNAQGRIDLIQIITAAGTLLNAAAGSNIRTPPNSILFDATFIMTVGVSQQSAGASAADVFVGVSGNQGSFLRIPVSGAAGVFRVVPANICAVNALNAGANGSEIYLSVNSQAGTLGADVSPLTGLLMLQYVTRA